MNPLKPFKKLPKGYYRLIIVGWIVLPIVVAMIAQSTTTRYTEDLFTPTLIFGIPIYYVLARFGVWIYDGFNEKEKEE